jgi:centrosomal protein CEP104
VSALLPVVGIAAEGSNEGFALSPLMAFVGPALGNSSAEVRGAAVALTVQVALVAGPSVQRMLPADLNPKIKEQIEQGMLGAAGVAPPSTAAAAAAAKAPLAAAGTRATPAATPAPPSRPQQAPPAGGRPAASPPSTQQQAAAQPKPAQQQQAAAGVRTPAAAVEVGDEAAVYTAELRSREARLGPNHPDVAEAVSNLAILHNQVTARWVCACCRCSLCDRCCEVPLLLLHIE